MSSPKYNRTMHLPWSKGATNDDKITDSISSLLGKPIVITEKIDGSNTSLEFDGCFARTHSSAPSHPSFDGLKSLHAAVKYKIPQGLQLFGEWVFAQHSIHYSELPSYFLLFNVRSLTPSPIWLSWEEVELWADEIGMPTVPLLFQGVISSEKELQDITESFMIQESCYGGIREGVVVRVKSEFLDNEFSQCVMKCVRANHVQTSEHWKNQEIIKNKLKSS
jgi:hypothetical protein